MNNQEQDEKNNKAVVRKYFEDVWNKANIDLLDETHHADYGLDRLMPWRTPGTAGLKAFILDNHRMFPDLHCEVLDILADGDKVVARVEWTGTHKGDLNGPVGLVPATGKYVTFRGIFIFQFQDGKVVYAWGVTDNMDLMQQLGAVPNPNVKK